MPQTIVNSPYLVQKLEKTPDENLFNYVKFHLTKDVLATLPTTEPKLLELGCGTQTAKRYLSKLGLKFEYFGVDYESTFQPDLVCDLLRPEGIAGKLPWEPDVLLLLDVLEHLHEDRTVLKDILGKCREFLPYQTKLVVTLPQMYRLDCLKLKHLHYPEHKIRLTQREWREVLSTHFHVDSLQGVGFLSVIPFIPMLFRSYKSDNSLGRLFHYLRSRTMEWWPFKPIDLLLSRTIGKIWPLHLLANDILFVLSSKKPNK